MFHASTAAVIIPHLLEVSTNGGSSNLKGLMGLLLFFDRPPELVAAPESSSSSSLSFLSEISHTICYHVSIGYIDFKVALQIKQDYCDTQVSRE